VTLRVTLLVLLLTPLRVLPLVAVQLLAPPA
jgi:hypothetical protein